MSKQAANPYRSILRRHMPEPLLALLIFVMGVWLWDNHFGKKEGWEDGVGQMTLRRADRELRLAESGGDMPEVLRKLLSIPDRDEALRTAVFSLEMLERDRVLDEEGAFALGVLRTMRKSNGALMPPPPDPDVIFRRVAQGEDFWWDREYLTRLGSVRRDGTVLQLPVIEPSRDPRSREVVMRAVLSRGAVWLLALCGLAFLPAVVRGYWGALKSRPRGYVGHWPTALGLGIFLLAYLASIGFGKALDGLIELTGKGGQPVVITPALYILIDAATRFLPALLAFAFLFRRGRHVWTRLGLNAAPDGKLVLGSFALLMIADQALRHFMLVDDVPDDPAGGLSLMEEGPWGLVFALTSACIAAPAAEEILYRGVLFRSLANGLRVPAATLISAVVFAVVHYYDAYGLVSVGLLGVACSLSFAASGRLVTAIILHALYNFAIKVPEWIVYHAPL